MENLKLIVLILIISLTFPVFAMGLTQFGEAEITKYDIAVSPEALVSLYIFGELTDYKSLYVYNSTIIQEWNDNYNWSMFRIPQEGLVMIIQPPPTSDNLTDAVYNDGMITITIGKSLEIDENINLRKIINWYMGLLLGDRTWGLPSFFTWIVRILTALSVLAMAVFLKEMLRL